MDERNETKDLASAKTIVIELNTTMSPCYDGYDGCCGCCGCFLSR